jgi:hypothetical protein
VDPKDSAMKMSCLRAAAILMLAAGPAVAFGQASAPPFPAASASPTGPRLLTPGESRERAMPPGNVGPERRVTPQVSVPLGRTPPPPSSATRDARPLPIGNPASAIGTGAARCESLRGEQVRAKCRDQQAREGRPR